MKFRHHWLLAIVFVFAACNDEPSSPISSTDHAGREAAFMEKSSEGIDVKDRYIVVFKQNVGNPDRLVDEMSRGAGMQVHYRYRHAIKGFAATIPAQALEGIRRNPNVDYVEADGIVSINQQNNPPSWGLDRINQRNLPLDNLYTWQNTGSEVKVYIIDTGIRYSHNEFGNRASFGFDAIDQNGNGEDCNGHGTHVAGTVGGSNVGVAKEVSLISVRVLNCQGSGTWSGVVAGVDWVYANSTPPAVANMSLGGGGIVISVEEAVQRTVLEKGVTFVVSAGNDNRSACNYSPARLPEVITVGATQNNDQRASYSNHGSCVDLFAPGSSIYSSTSSGNNTYATYSGTSMAAPHVAGVAAIYLYANPNASPTQVSNAILSGATSGALTGNLRPGSPNLLLYSLIAGTPSQGNPPAAPDNLTATAASSSAINLNWDDKSDNEDGFKIERKNGSTWVEIASLGANVTTYTNTGLSASTQYTYRVYAYNGYGNSSYSTEESATTLQCVSPTAPSSLQATATSSSAISLSWTYTSTNEDGFKIERSTDGSNFAHIASVGAGVTTYSDAGLASSTTYYYRVRAFNTCGESGYSSIAQATTDAAQQLTTVYVSSASASKTSVQNRWTASLTVTVSDGSSPVSGATVHVSWSGGASGSGTAVTDAYGVCTVTTSILNPNVSWIDITVSDVTGSGLSYGGSPGVTLPIRVYKP